jgi:hypothetical protein
MISYKQVLDIDNKTFLKVVNRLSDNAFIPFDPNNTDYAQFKKDILDGAELLDADGQVMDAIQFVKELP